uniref:Reverse transcriptase domain-containing protein n=1 Tax=Macrostomum lignano TaxID=282301 RepID=A0A1I8FKF7_9PLAT
MQSCSPRTVTRPSGSPSREAATPSPTGGRWTVEGSAMSEEERMGLVVNMDGEVLDLERTQSIKHKRWTSPAARPPGGSVHRAAGLLPPFHSACLGLGRTSRASTMSLIGLLRAAEDDGLSGFWDRCRVGEASWPPLYMLLKYLLLKSAAARRCRNKIRPFTEVDAYISRLRGLGNFSSGGGGGGGLSGLLFRQRGGEPPDSQPTRWARRLPMVGFRHVPSAGHPAGRVSGPTKGISAEFSALISSLQLLACATNGAAACLSCHDGAEAAQGAGLAHQTLMQAATNLRDGDCFEKPILHSQHCSFVSTGCRINFWPLWHSLNTQLASDLGSYIRRRATELQLAAAARSPRASWTTRMLLDQPRLGADLPPARPVAGSCCSAHSKLLVTGAAPFHREREPRDEWRWLNLVRLHLRWAHWLTELRTSPGGNRKPARRLLRAGWFPGATSTTSLFHCLNRGLWRLRHAAAHGGGSAAEVQARGRCCQSVLETEIRADFPPDKGAGHDRDLLVMELYASTLPTKVQGAL